jgi:hypothetical protein
VELFQAGLKVNGAHCGAEVTVPSSIELKRLVGDRDPFLSLADKVSSAATHHDPPFDGRCHGCREADADYETSITLSYLDERQVDDDGGITVAPGLVIARVGGGREFWREVVFPLQLCKRCQARFEAERPGLFGLLFVNCVFGVFVIFAFLVLIVLAAVLHVGILLGVLVFGALLTYRLRKRGPEFLLAWLEPIPFAGDLVRAQDEYRIRLEKPVAYSRSAKPAPEGRRAMSGGDGITDRRDAAIIACPRCGVTVLPTRDGYCPSCRNIIVDA